MSYFILVACVCTICLRLTCPDYGNVHVYHNQTISHLQTELGGRERGCLLKGLLVVLSPWKVRKIKGERESGAEAA